MRNLKIEFTEIKNKELSIDFKNNGFTIFEILGFIEKLKFDIINNHEKQKQSETKNKK